LTKQVLIFTFTTVINNNNKRNMKDNINTTKEQITETAEQNQIERLVALIPIEVKKDLRHLMIDINGNSFGDVIIYLNEHYQKTKSIAA